MSRTYHHGRKAKERRFGNGYYTGGCPPHDPAPPKKRRHKDRWHWMNTPGWWIKEMMTVPWRAETRQLLHKVKKLRDLEEAPLFPNGRRPHVYYW